MAEKKESQGQEVARWDPFGEFRRWHPFRESLLPRHLGDVFEQALRDWPAARELNPALDVHEDDKSFTVSVELPGMKREDVSVELHDNVLTIRGEKKSERDEKKEQARYLERRFGSFSRSFSLPPNAVPDKISASFESGVLTLSIPKGEEAKPRAISIKG